MPLMTPQEFDRDFFGPVEVREFTDKEPIELFFPRMNMKSTTDFFKLEQERRLRELEELVQRYATEWDEIVEGEIRL